MAPISRKNGSDLVHTKPKILSFPNSSPVIRVDFENIGCISFCQKIQKVGHDVKLACLFALNFQDNRVKLGDLEILLFERFVTDATNLPKMGEKWIKGDELDILAFKKFVKVKYLDKFASTFPSTDLQEQYVDLL